MGHDAFISQFIAALRAREELLRDYGANEAAAACGQIANELELAFREWWLAELPVAEAAAESGYSPERIRELVREKRLPDQRADDRGEIRVRRGDLPRRPGPPSPNSAVEALAGRLGHRG
jgi:hypothetical protein